MSVSTVSHVINGTRRVSPETASLVRAVIDATDYHPNVVARSLKTASTRSVGIAISAIANPYFTDIICSIEAECARLGGKTLVRVGHWLAIRLTSFRRAGRRRRNDPNEARGRRRTCKRRALMQPSNAVRLWIVRWGVRHCVTKSLC